MPLVTYSDSEDSDGDTRPPPPSPPWKKRKLDESPSRPNVAKVLPPLPSSFRDLYSSTVRTSTRDDPALHGGRKRVTPHVEGNWPAHVYLEWNPEPAEYEQLFSLIERERKRQPECDVRSLLHNELGVALPLHVSLSRPLVLKTEQKGTFLDQLKQAVTSSGSRGFEVTPAELRWHPNETDTRWFLVLQLLTPEKHELRKLLKLCNNLVAAFSQPLLYTDADAQAQTDSQNHTGSDDFFHISIAWSLSAPSSATSKAAGDRGETVGHGSENITVSEVAMRQLEVAFSKLKVRVGQDVTPVPLRPSRATDTAQSP